MFYIVSAIFAWGVWAVAEKLALRNGSPMGVLMLNATFGWLCVMIASTFSPSRDASTSGSWIAWAGIAGAAGIIANLCFMTALQTRPTTEVMSWTQLYPLVTYALCMAFLKEELTLQKLIGGAFMIAGAVIMNR